jgi:BirA family transcriptional regulator, biotin operon repressor / biotin---[acetyl-CoA-carboxylase] ligase
VDLPVLVLADRQTAGRGRGANRWWTGPGSLAFTLLVNTSSWNVPRERVSLTALVAGIALVEAVAPRIAQNPVGLHWPNDVYVGDRKLAGILVEMPTENRLVVGVGVNTNCRLADAPTELQERVATMFDLTGKCQDHTSLLVDWLDGWESWIRLLSPRGDEIGRRADALCLQRGQSLQVRLGTELHHGRCLGIAPSGALRLETSTGIREFRSGTIE